MCIDSKKVYYNEDYILPVPTSPDSNLVFDGWYSDADGEGTRYTDGNGNGIGVWLIDDDVTVIAHWVRLFDFADFV